MGGLIPFISNFNNITGSTVNNATYISFMTIMSLGAISSVILKSPSEVFKADGTLVDYQENRPSLKSEFQGIFRLFLEAKIVCLIPAFFTSNFFYAYHFNVINGKIFNLRTRGLNNTIYWGVQMIGSYAYSVMVLDNGNKSRKSRGTIGIIILFIFSVTGWGMCTYLQLKFTRSNVSPQLDFMDIDSIFPMFLYIIFGFLDSIFQNFIYWLLGCLSNSGNELGRYVGFYKAVQSLGAAASWRVKFSLFTSRLILLALITFFSVF